MRCLLLLLLLMASWQPVCLAGSKRLLRIINTKINELRAGQALIQNDTKRIAEVMQKLTEIEGKLGDAERDVMNKGVRSSRRRIRGVFEGEFCLLGVLVCVYMHVLTYLFLFCVWIIFTKKKKKKIS